MSALMFGNASSSGSTGFANPMTTPGDMIVGATVGIAARLANGSSGQLLTCQGGTATPAWITPPNFGFYQGYVANGPFWTTSVTGFTTGINSGGNALTNLVVSGVSVAAAGNSLPAISLTPGYSGAAYVIDATVANINFASARVDLLMTDGTTPFAWAQNVVGNAVITSSIRGVYSFSSSAAVTLAILLASSAGGSTARIQASGTTVPVIQWTISQIK